MELKTIGTGSKGNCYVLYGDKSHLLIECGLPYEMIAKKLNHNFKDIIACLVSHEHKDHCKGIKGIIDNTEMGIMGTRGTLKNLGVKLPEYRKKVMLYNKPYQIDEWNIRAFKVNHDAVQPSGFLIENHDDKIVFITDTNKLNYFFKDLTHIIIEANYSEELLQQSDYPEPLRKRIRESHLELNQAIHFIKTCQENSDKIESVTIIHYSKQTSNIDMFRNEIEIETGLRCYVANKDY